MSQVDHTAVPAEVTDLASRRAPAAVDDAHPDVGQLQTVARLVITPVFRFLWRIRTEGLDRVPASGPAILAPNHTSVLDSFFLPCVLPRGITFVGKAEYLDDWKTRKLFPALGMIPIDRSGGSASERALNTAARVLERGELFGIYPEGTRSRSGLLHKGHTGMARLALRVGAPIVPVGITGTRDIQPPEAKLPKPFMTATVRFGRPIDVSRYQGRHDDRLLLRQITDEVMFEIRELTGQEYVNTYATKGAAAAGANGAVIAEPERRSSAELLGARTG
jgi:1-acyl-sn-glycerol-3-phosphate acyltransferase